MVKVPLVPDGLVVRYYIDEAASGQGPTAVLDGSGVGAAFDLAITYAASLNYTEIGGNRGLENTGIVGNQICEKAIDPTSDKVRDNIHGAQKFTITVVARIDDFSGGMGRCFAINENSSSNAKIGLTGNSPTAAKTFFNGTVMRTWDPGTVRTVTHIVFDTTQATANDRVKVYKDKVLQSPTIDANPALNATVDLPSTSRIVMFNRGPSGSRDRSMDGVLFYADLHSIAYTQAQVTNDFDILTADDDTPAGGEVLLAGTAAAVSSLAGALPVEKKLGATVAAVSSLTGALPVEKLIAGIVPAVSSLSGALPVDRDLISTVATASTLAGSLTIAGEKLLAGIVAAASTLSGQLPVSKPIAGTVAAASTLQAILERLRSIAGSSDAVSALTGDLTKFRALAGQIAGGSTLAGALRLQWALRGVIAGISTVPGSIEVERKLAALVAASASLSGALTVTSNVVEAQEGFSMPGRPQGFDFVRPQGFDTRKRKPGFDT